MAALDGRHHIPEAPDCRSDARQIAMVRNPQYAIRIDWQGDSVGLIRDYRYVPYLNSELAFEPGS